RMALGVIRWWRDINPCLLTGTLSGRQAVGARRVLGIVLGSRHRFVRGNALHRSGSLVLRDRSTRQQQRNNREAQIMKPHTHIVLEPGFGVKVSAIAGFFSRIWITFCTSATTSPASSFTSTESVGSYFSRVVSFPRMSSSCASVSRNSALILPLPGLRKRILAAL